jgi:hypothetical protein
MPVETDLIIDQPNATDFTYEALFGWISETKVKRLRVPKIKVFNQWENLKSKMWCWIYWLTHIVNAQNIISDTVNKVKHTELNPFIIWKEKILPVNPKAEFEWTTLQSNLDLFKKLWLITWYARVVSKEEIMDSLDHQRYIYTWSQTWDWINVRNTHIYKLRTDWKLVWHITSYFTYDETYVYWLNSYWTNNGVIKCPWDLFLNNFYTKYACSDSRDETAFIKFRETYKN